MTKDEIKEYKRVLHILENQVRRDEFMYEQIKDRNGKEGGVEWEVQQKALKSKIENSKSKIIDINLVLAESGY